MLDLPVVEVRRGGRVANLFYRGNLWKRSCDPDDEHGVPRWERVVWNADSSDRIPITGEPSRILEGVFLNLRCLTQVRRFPRFGPKQILQVGVTKFWIRPGTSDERVVREVVSSDVYLRFLPRSEDDVWLDIGANIGAFAVRVSPICRSVICFEPDPENFALLRRNIDLNHCLNVSILREAVSGRRNGSRVFYLNQRTNKGAHSFYVKRGRKRIVVPTRDIWSLVEEFKPTKLKLDCEGAEYEILSALGNRMGRLDGIVLEYHFNILRDREHQKYFRLIQLLKSHFPRVKYAKDPKKNWTTIISAYKD